MAEGGIAPVFPQGEVGVYEKPHRPDKLFIGLSVFMIIALLIVGYLLYRRYFIPETVIPQTESVPAPMDTAAPKTGIVASDPVPLLTDANYRSENFRVGEIAIGGEAEFIMTENIAAPIAISGIRGESFVEKNKPEVKLVLSWKTNKLAKSDISYSKGVGQPKKTVSEEDYSLNHSMIISGLDQASTYVYEIVANDRFGNQVTSESHAVYTGSKTVSLFDLIAGAVGDVFGWAVKKN